MKNLWNDSADIKNDFPSLSKNIYTPVLVIGGGLAGILTAYLLKNNGIDCVLVETNRVGMGITKNTTAKITSQHGLIYADLLSKIGRENSGKYLFANENAIKKYKSICKNLDCDFSETSAFVYSRCDSYRIENEVKTVKELGLDAEFVSNIELPITIKGAIKFKNQAQFNPLKFINHISKDLVIYENTPAILIDKNHVSTPKADITAESIIITTHFPFVNRYGFYFLKMYQQRSYVLGLKNAQNLENMYIDEKENKLSFRGYNDILLLGGGGHRTGEVGGGYGFLKHQAKIIYPKSEIAYSWATQDCITLDGMPYIGKYSKKFDNIFVATGFNKWGMTSSMVSAQILSDMIVGKKNPYASVFSPQRFTLNKRFFIHLGKTLKNFVYPSKKRCSHLGCALKYNRQEHSWDCACHGSRFSKEGDLLDNPATKGVNIE